MDQFLNYEIKGRIALERFFKQHPDYQVELFEFEEDKYSSIDGSYYSGSNSYYKTFFELKTCDKMYAHKWKDGNGFIFEYIKYKALKNKVKNTSDRCVFIKYCIDAIVIWDITRMEIDNIEWKMVEYSGTHQKKEKEIKKVIYLDWNTASHIIPIH